MQILGAGMAGLLAGGMIRDRQFMIYEAAPSIPNNHSAVLRFRSTAVGDALDIEFKAVDMMKCVHEWRNPVADSLAYSVKCNGTASLRSILSADSSKQRRYIAPPDLIQRMSDRIQKSNNGEIHYGVKVTKDHLSAMGGPIISTIPMPIMMDILEYPDKPHFSYVNGYNVNCNVAGADAYVSVYVPDPVEAFNRVSLTGSTMTIEVSLPGKTADEVAHEKSTIEKSTKETDEIIRMALFCVGLDKASVTNIRFSLQRYSKILPINENDRKQFIIWATEKYNMYSLGRFATWRPGLLLDDVVNDVRVIRRIMKNGSYDQRKKWGM